MFIILVAALLSFPSSLPVQVVVVVIIIIISIIISISGSDRISSVSLNNVLAQRPARGDVGREPCWGQDSDRMAHHYCLLIPFGLFHEPEQNSVHHMIYNVYVYSLQAP